MEKLDSVFDLLDFSLDCDGDDKKGDGKTISNGDADTAAFGRDGSVPDPDAEEEELEWLSNKDAFPSVESCFGILSDNPQLLLSNHQNSFVSVLGNADADANNGNGNGNGSAVVVPPNFPLETKKSRMGRKRRLNYGALLNIKPSGSGSGSSSTTETTERRCLHCQANTTPQWRTGPMGPKTLCNACGVRFKSGRLLPEYRPANSPTFSSALHSNSHRKVVEMRDRKQMGDHV